jgi:hypothetical protein
MPFFPPGSAAVGAQRRSAKAPKIAEKPAEKPKAAVPDYPQI